MSILGISPVIKLVAFTW